MSFPSCFPQLVAIICIFIHIFRISPVDNRRQSRRIPAAQTRFADADRDRDGLPRHARERTAVQRGERCNEKTSRRCGARRRPAPACARRNGDVFHHTRRRAFSNRFSTGAFRRSVRRARTPCRVHGRRRRMHSEVLPRKPCQEAVSRWGPYAGGRKSASYFLRPYGGGASGSFYTVFT
jgi:hypothetical protein